MAKTETTPAWWHSPTLDALDRRTRRTREAMYLALIGLLQEKPLNAISVTELTRAADINRSTFYLHFTDIYNMFEHMRGDFQSGLEAMVAEHAEEFVRGNVRPVLRDAYGYFAGNREMFNRIFGQSGGQAGFGDTVAVIREAWLARVCPNGARNRWRSRYIVDFVARGIIGMAQSWIEGGCREPVDEMVELSERLIGDVRDVEATESEI